MKPKISISIVSHAQGNLVGPLISDLIRHCRNEPIEVLLTLNIPENLPFRPEHQPFPLRILENASPLGFSANHNKASAEAKGTFFCVLNPDVRLRQNPYTQLLSFLENPNIGVIAPQVLNSAGENENNSRNFPTPFEIAGKLFGRTSAKQETTTDDLSFPDWVAGMFMLFPMKIFREMGGFDTRYFLYYEDVDLCARLTLNGYRVALCQNVSIIHDAQRSSHYNFQYLKWHLASLIRFFRSPVYQQLKQRNSMAKQKISKN